MRKNASPFAVMKVSSFVYSLVCSECGKGTKFESTVEFKTHDRPTLPDGWKYSPKGNDKTVCPHCFMLLKKEQAKSENLYERINGGAFDSQSPNFEPDASFYNEAIKFVGLEGHPKASKAYSMAEDRGHSAGISEVLSNLSELAELLKD